MRAWGPFLGWGAFYGFVMAAWATLALMAAEVAGLAGAPAEIWEALCRSAAEAAFGPLFLMWALMAVAMMLPGFVPALRTFLDLPGAATAGGRAGVALVAGFLCVWLLAAGVGALAQQALARAAWVSPLGQSLSPWLTGGLLVGAGLYQFSALKAACLTRCRLPLTYFLERWRPGYGAAARMGAGLGLACLGCCWALMALAFVGGTMNILWMGVATVFMTVEKLPWAGRYVSAPAGVLLIAGGLWVLVRAAVPI